MNALVRVHRVIVRLDNEALLWAGRFRAPMVDRIMRSFTRAGDAQAWLLFFLIAQLFGHRSSMIAWHVLPRLLITFSVCRLIKVVSRRKRPNQTVQDFYALLKNPDPYSFPSSHSACAWTVSISLRLVIPHLWPVFILYAVGVSYSRVHVGAHYPLDVGAGALIGAAIALI